MKQRNFRSLSIICQLTFFVHKKYLNDIFIFTPSLQLERVQVRILSVKLGLTFFRVFSPSKNFFNHDVPLFVFPLLISLRFCTLLLVIRNRIFLFKNISSFFAIKFLYCVKVLFFLSKFLFIFFV